MLYGGARYGGKTDFLLGDWLQDVPTYGPLWQGIVFRRTYDPELRETMRRAHQLYPQTGGKWFEGDREWRWPNGAILRLRHLDGDKDALAHQGQAYTWIGWDELGQWPTDYGYRFMIGSFRSAGGPVPTKRIRSTGNPGGAGHQWVKSRFISPAPGGYVPVLDETTGMERLFIPSRAHDNQIGMTNDPEYVNRLRGTGSEALVRAWLDGDWDVVEGAYFDNWSSARHVVRPVELPRHWTRFRALDWGSAKPFAVAWLAVSDGELQQFPDGAVVMYREWYGMRDGRPNVGVKMDAEEVAAGILEAEDGAERIAYGVADPSIWKSDSGPSVAERFARSGVVWRRGDNARVAGWEQVRKRLNGEDGRPMLYVFDTCPHLIRTLPAMQHDVHRPEDLDTDGEDHMSDCLRYGLMSRPYAAEVVSRAPPRFLAEATFDEILADHDRQRRHARVRV